MHRRGEREEEGEKGETKEKEQAEGEEEMEEKSSCVLNVFTIQRNKPYSELLFTL